jgi:hypothetical protein
MSDMSDLLPSRDATYDLGSSANKWYALYCMQLSDGTVTRAVGDLATREDYALLGQLPALTAGDDGKFLTVYNRRFELSLAPAGVLPVVSPFDNGMYLVSRGGNWVPAYMPVLPVVTVAENDYILKVIDGIWKMYPSPLSLPNVTVMDNGKILQVYLGVWQAVAPPSDVLPPVNEGDHGSILVAESESTGWTKWMLGRATSVRDGLVPKLPAVKSRVLMGDNTWAAAPTGASGQWVVGDVRHCLRDPGTGWIPLDGRSVSKASGDAFKALFLAVGGTGAEWEQGVSKTLPALAQNYVRYMPDTVASVNFGIVMELKPAQGPTHVELELYRHPADTAFVLQANTYFKINTVYNFDVEGIPFSSSSPGFFVQDGALWRLFASGGETVGARTLVLFDTGEASKGDGVAEVVSAGAYYYRWRQVDGGVPGEWTWQRILTTGGLNREEAQVVKLCDVFATGRPTSWKSPAVAVTMYALSEAGMEEIYADENDRVEVTTRLRAGSRLSLVGHGNLKLTGDADRMDMFAVFPQYTAVEQQDSPPVVDTVAAYGGTPYTALVAFYTQNGYVRVVDSDGPMGSKGFRIDVNTLASSWADSYYGAGVFNNNYRFFYGMIEGVERPVSVPDTQATLYYDVGSDRRFFNAAWKAIPAGTGIAGWAYPYFTFGCYVNGRNLLFPGEAPGIWDCDGETLIPFPPGTVFKGGPAGTVGPDGCVYVMPRFTNSDISQTRSTGMLRFDPFDDSFEFIQVPWELVAVKTDVYGWHKAITLKDGRLLFVPYGEANFVMYDVRYRSLTRTSFGQALPDDFKWMNAGVLADGTVVGVGCDAEGLGSLSFRFYPDMTSMDTFLFGYPLTRSVRAMAALPDGSLVVAAFELLANNVRVFRISAGGQKYVPGTFSPYVNKV